MESADEACRDSSRRFAQPQNVLNVFFRHNWCAIPPDSELPQRVLMCAERGGGGRGHPSSQKVLRAALAPMMPKPPSCRRLKSILSLLRHMFRSSSILASTSTGACPDNHLPSLSKLQRSTGLRLGNIVRYGADRAQILYCWRCCCLIANGEHAVARSLGGRCKTAMVESTKTMEAEAHRSCPLVAVDDGGVCKLIGRNTLRLHLLHQGPRILRTPSSCLSSVAPQQPLGGVV